MPRGIHTDDFSSSIAIAVAAAVVAAAARIRYPKLTFLSCRRETGATITYFPARPCSRWEVMPRQLERPVSLRISDRFQGRSRFGNTEAQSGAAIFKFMLRD